MLSVVAGRGLRETVIAFCRTHNLSESNTDSLEKGLRARVLHPPSLDLLLGVVISKTGDRVSRFTHSLTHSISTTILLRLDPNLPSPSSPAHVASVRVERGRELNGAGACVLRAAKYNCHQVRDRRL